MKNKILLLLIGLCSLSVFAQDPYIIPQGTPTEVRDVKGGMKIRKALVLPVGDHTQVYPQLDSLALIQVNADTGELEYHNGTEWVTAGGGGSSQDIQQTLENGSIGFITSGQIAIGRYNNDMSQIAAVVLNSTTAKLSSAGSSVNASSGLVDILVEGGTVINMTENNIEPLVLVKYANESSLRPSMSGASIPSVTKVEEMIAAAVGGTPDLDDVLEAGSVADISEYVFINANGYSFTSSGGFSSTIDESGSNPAYIYQTELASRLGNQHTEGGTTYVSEVRTENSGSGTTKAILETSVNYNPIKIEIDGTDGIKIYDTVLEKGISEAVDYSANYTGLSLPNKNYVDSVAGGGLQKAVDNGPEGVLAYEDSNNVKFGHQRADSGLNGIVCAPDGTYIEGDMVKISTDVLLLNNHSVTAKDYSTSASSLELALVTTSVDMHFTHTGDVATWQNLPLAGYDSFDITIVNMGTGAITLSSNSGGNDFFAGTLTDEIVIAINTGIKLHNNGSKWIVTTLNF